MKDQYPGDPLDEALRRELLFKTDRAEGQARNLYETVDPEPDVPHSIAEGVARAEDVIAISEAGPGEVPEGPSSFSEAVRESQEPDIRQ